MSQEVLDRLKSQIDGLNGKLSQFLDRANTVGDIETDSARMTMGSIGGAPAVAYYESNPSPLMKSHTLRKKLRFNPGQLPAGYKPMFKSYAHFMREGMRGSDEFAKFHKGSIEQLIKAQSLTTSDPDALGFLVLPEFAPDIAEILYNEDDLLGATDQYTVEGNRMAFPRLDERSRASGVRHGGLTGGWIDEGDLAVPTKARMLNTELKLKKLAVVVFLTDELIADNSYAIEQWVTRAVRREIQFMVNDAIFSGTGGGRPLGFLNAPGTVVVTKESGQVNGTILAMNILKMYSRRRPSTPLKNLRWLINQDIEPQLYSMTLPASGSVPGVVYLPPGGLSGSPYATLMGIPVQSCEFSKTLGTKGDIALVDMNGYVTISKGGVNEAASQHVEFLREQTAIKFTLRLDGRPMYDEPTTPYNGTATQGDFIVLENR